MAHASGHLTMTMSDEDFVTSRAAMATGEKIKGDDDDYQSGKSFEQAAQASRKGGGRPHAPSLSSPQLQTYIDSLVNLWAADAGSLSNFGATSGGGLAAASGEGVP